MESMTKTPSTPSPMECRVKDKKSILDNLETVSVEDLIEDLNTLAPEVFLEALPEESDSDKEPASPKGDETEVKGQEAESGKTNTNYFGRQGSFECQNSFYVWNTGYFADLSDGKGANNGELWKDRSLWPSESRLKEMRMNRMTNKEGGHSCGVLFWGW